MMEHLGKLKMKSSDLFHSCSSYALIQLTQCNACNGSLMSYTSVNVENTMALKEKAAGVHNQHKKACWYVRLF